MTKQCRHCQQVIEWDRYWGTWDHTNREDKLYAELCAPELGFQVSRRAAP